MQCLAIVAACWLAWSACPANAAEASPANGGTAEPAAGVRRRLLPLPQTPQFSPGQLPKQKPVDPSLIPDPISAIPALDNLVNANAPQPPGAVVRLPPVNESEAPNSFSQPVSTASQQPTNTSAEAGAADKDKADSKPLGEAPEDVSKLFLRQAGVMLKPGQGQFDVGLNYIFSEVQLPSVLANNQLANDRQRLRRFLAPMTVRYGITEKSEVFGRLPVGFAVFEQANFDRDEVTTRGGLGDVGGGIKYLLWQEKETHPDVIGALSFSAPTGSNSFHGNAFTGLGSWTVSADLNFIKSYDPLTLFWGVGYTHAFSADFAGQRFHPGETFRYSLGVGFAVNDDMVLSGQFVGLYQTYSYLGNQRLPNSIPEPMALRLALTRVISKDKFFEPFVAFGLTSDSPDVQIGASWTWNFGAESNHESSASSSTNTNTSTNTK